MGRPSIDMTGKRIGQLVVLDRAGAWDKQIWWRCQCDCGNIKTISGATLRRGKTRSCGCVYKASRVNIAHKSIAKVKHGDSFARLYFMWGSMKARCENPNNISYSDYGGRGIKLCEEWHDYAKFKEWALAAGYDETAPRGGCTIDRTDPNGNYCPENCTWQNMTTQSNNRRNTPMLTINGETDSLTNWARRVGLPRNLLYSRYRRGWRGEEVISPQDQHRRRECALHSTQESQPKTKQSTD